MKAQLLTLFLAAAAILPAAVAGQDNVWYMDGAAYTGTYDPETHTLSFNGGTMTEERTFTLVAKDPNDPAPTFFRLVGDAPAFLPPGTATRDGLLLRPARASRENSATYEPIAGAKPINLIRLNGTMGRWPMTASAPLQHTMLKHLSTTALLYMRSEILARHGATFKNSPKLRNYFNRQPWYEPGDDAYHLSAIELMNIEIIKTEESMRAETKQ